MPLLSCRRSLSLAVITTAVPPALAISAKMVLARRSSGPVITSAWRVTGSKVKLPEMPWTEGGLPVTRERLLGQVKLGMVPSAMALKP